jgi:hypothetical protein
LDWDTILERAAFLRSWIVAVIDSNQIESEFALIKLKHGIPQDMELKGHGLPPKVLSDVLRLLLKEDAFIGIVLLDKRHALETKAIWPKPAIVRHQIGVQLVKSVLDRIVVRTLHCDEDIRGRLEQQAFRTEILRYYALIHSRSKIKISLRPSDKSTLIQCGDIVTYVAARSLRPNGLTVELQFLWQCLQNRQNTVYSVLYKWEE